MKKIAVISNRIFMELPEPEIVLLEKKLTYVIPPLNPVLQKPEYIRNCRRVKGNVVSIPVGRTDLIPTDYEIIDKRVLAPVDFPEPKSSLSEGQMGVYDNFNDNGILNAFVGWGKTFTSLHIAKKLGQKTIVVVHNTSLREQWIEEIEKLFGFTPGIIGSSNFNIHPIITVANVQTLVNHITAVNDSFGTVILDEAHHVPATTFAKVVDQFKAKYKIGLTGTLQRKDGKHVVFQDYFGKAVFRPKAERIMTPTVQAIRTPFQLPQAATWQDRVTELLDNNEAYQQFIASIAKAKADMGHKVLIVADRIKFLHKAAEFAGDGSAVVVGTTSLDDRAAIHNDIKNGKINKLFGTLSIYKEGISQNNLSCLIIATPINNEPLLVQLIGRVIREADDKLNPVIIDIQLARSQSQNTARNQASSRIATYMKLGYEVVQL